VLILGLVNTLITLKDLNELVLFRVELYKQHYSLETNVSSRIF
jgi:hypothetical protein